jgi:hypothetical protein
MEPGYRWAQLLANSAFPVASGHTSIACAQAQREIKAHPPETYAGSFAIVEPKTIAGTAPRRLGLIRDDVVASIWTRPVTNPESLSIGLGDSTLAVDLSIPLSTNVQATLEAPGHASKMLTVCIHGTATVEEVDRRVESDHEQSPSWLDVRPIVMNQGDRSDASRDHDELSMEAIYLPSIENRVTHQQPPRAVRTLSLDPTWATSGKYFGYALRRRRSLALV